MRKQTSFAQKTPPSNEPPKYALSLLSPCFVHAPLATETHSVLYAQSYWELTKQLVKQQKAQINSPPPEAAGPTRISAVHRNAGGAKDPLAEMAKLQAQLAELQAALTRALPLAQH